MTQITFDMNDWLTNASLEGLYRILKNEGHEPQINKLGNGFSFSSDLLDNFPKMYFHFFLNQYQVISSYAKIMAYEDKLNQWENEHYQNFSFDDFKNFRDYLQNILKYYTKSNSFKKIYPLMTDSLDVIDALKTLTKLPNATTEKAFNSKKDAIIQAVMQVSVQLKPIYAYFNSPQAKQYFPVLSTLYTVVNNTWSNLSYFNRGNKEPDFYVAYAQTFVDPVKTYLNEEHSKDKYRCSSCGRPIAKREFSYSFLTDMGFDAARKTSNVWDFNSDLYICPICQLMYSCASAGFNFVNGHGLFINDSHDVQGLTSTNERIASSIWNTRVNSNGRYSTPYAAMITALTDEKQSSYDYSFEDVQVVRYENEHYQFNLLSKKVLRVFQKSRKAFHTIRSANFTLNGSRHYVFEDIASHVINSQNLFLYTNQLLRVKATNPNNAYVFGSQVQAILEINANLLEEINDD
ncbi:hypothetical protein IV38_GL000151 [Lactobacillus selangorensis]|uniref:CRISPR-associated protein CXXC-CXXC domain-containing protein n=1 Tax=Lactobacillus selangorensis TaxID=81857 RepID=A0A0R2GA87_9LACO|nr:Cas8a1 family CRISPR/Cas system-associated protein [Lactobacillus selangorensis]KRN29269.1 hypothetical protein IV38_GL000151 [Lactobacillus selangorensis]KRN34202.1 hypothetical protein IV40_GL000518 [Lactobacillus selangorensis]